MRVLNFTKFLRTGSVAIGEDYTSNVAPLVTRERIEVISLTPEQSSKIESMILNYLKDEGVL